MKLGEVLQQVGRPVAFYPNLARCLGGIKEAVLFGQLLYWLGKEQEAGWIWKTAQELNDETALTYKEQKLARKNLRDLGVLEERFSRLAHRTYFRLNLDRLDELWTEWTADGQPDRRSLGRKATAAQARARGEGGKWPKSEALKKEGIVPLRRPGRTFEAPGKDLSGVRESTVEAAVFIDYSGTTKETTQEISAPSHGSGALAPFSFSEEEPKKRSRENADGDRERLLAAQARQLLGGELA